MTPQRGILALATWWTIAAASWSCGGGGADQATPPTPMPEAGTDAGNPPPVEAGPPAPARCLQALAQPLPARISVMSTKVGSGPTFVTVTRTQIYQTVQDHCSRCHTPNTALGGFVMTSPADMAQPGGMGFATKAEWALSHIRSDGMTPMAPDESMPPLDSPEGKPWSIRMQTQDDPIVILANWLDAWLKAGMPPSFTVAADPSGASTSYLMSLSVGNGMTNLGNCIPEPGLVASEVATAQKLDEMFANLKRASLEDVASGAASPANRVGLPLHLSETDLTTFDGATLARMGVVAFVPQYPLWSDDAGKLRHVRVPRGTSIRFDKATQQFEIPPNTRFYKTFMKKIVDTDGNESWRKVETRLIVARPDPEGTLGAPQLDTTKIDSLFGMYRWNEDETEATLQTVPLNDKEGFKDVVLEYDTNVDLAARLRAENPDPDRAERALSLAKAVRHYAMPSSQRCIHCHMGSVSRDFVLGFRPVQIKHRPIGEGGVIEPSGPDELTQLQRLIDYGIVTGVDSTADILPLEEMEGDRKPRNDYELEAQGYMLGNCAHCHNPNGFPTVSFPQLRDVGLDFQPSPTGGIFQFPLDKFSPRIKRGIAGDVQIPYITPSLVDHPSHPPDVDPNSPATADFWRPKWFLPSVSDLGPTPAFVYAPWRSLVYRNVDTPFAYSDDFALYPHMPMDTPGYDVRTKRILGDWMVSIPAVRKRPDIAEYRTPFPLASDVNPDAATFVPDDNPQPYVEVKPGEAGFDGAVAAAEGRLAIFHTGTQSFESIPNNKDGFYQYHGRYAATLDSSDTIDPEVDGVCSLTPIEKEIPTINVPTHPHWVPLDLTQSPGDWVPRRGDWKDVLVDQNVPPPVNACAGDPNLAQAKFDDMKHVVSLIRNKKLDDTVTVDGMSEKFREFATTKVAMGLWLDKPECDWSKPGLADQKTLADVSSKEHHPWMDVVGADAAQRRVYSQMPGAAIFNMICINCHGSKFDSVGRLAENLATMTGGKSRVADLRDGLFGPVGDPKILSGSNRSGVFSAVAEADGVGADDWGARYMSFMALGGTAATIPPAFLTNVSRTLVFGESRPALVPPKSANMLSIARELCLATLSTPTYHFGLPAGSTVGYFDAVNSKTPTKQLWKNGDAELWLKLCSLDNPPPVLPYLVVKTSDPTDGVLPIVSNVLDNRGFEMKQASLVTGLTPPAVVRRCAYEPGMCTSDMSRVPDGSVGDERGSVSKTLEPTNLHPWCVLDVSVEESAKPAEVAAFFRDVCLGGPNCVNGKCTGDPSGCDAPPKCPVTVDTNPDARIPWDDGVGSAANEWAIKGAINAGFAVFLYLDSVAKSGGVANPTYDHCEQLQP